MLYNYNQLKRKCRDHMYLYLFYKCGLEKERSKIIKTFEPKYVKNKDSFKINLVICMFS